MSKKTDYSKLMVIFSSLFTALFLVMELYVMVNYSHQFLMIGIVGVGLLASLFAFVAGLVRMSELKEAARKEQYENLVKSQKASYLMLKKHFEEMEGRLTIIEKSAKIPTEEIVGTQKGIGKVIISRSRENAEALMNSNDLLIERVDAFEETLNNNNAQLMDSYKEMGNEQLQQMVAKQQDLLVDMKDMELRINNAIMDVQKLVASLPSSIQMPTPNIQVVAPQPGPMPGYGGPGQPMPQPPMPPMPPMQPMAGPMPEIQPAPMPEPMPAPASEASPAAEAMPEPEPIPEVVPEAVLEPEVISEPIPEAEPEVNPEPVVEEKPPMPDLSDPNKKMSADEIAALFANMGVDSTAEPAPEAEAIPEAAPEPEPVSEPVVEEKPPMPDLSDPNKKMSPDEIAALFANMGGDSSPAPEPEPVPEPVVEEKPPMPDLSDPNKTLSPDEIAALFANMG